MSSHFQTTWHWAGLDEGTDRYRVLGDAVRGEAVRLLGDEYADRLRAMVVTGSLARDEATVIKEQGCWKCLGDAEFLLVFDERAAMPTSMELEPFVRQIEARLEQRNIFCHVVAGTCRANGLSRFRPSIFAYELRTQGKVVWGNKEILSLLPDFSASDIPREDAFCMLSNRMIEQLEFANEFSPSMTQLSPPLFYRVVKLYLDMATSLLIFTGAYRPTYCERAEQVEFLADSRSSAQEFPFPLREFADRVRDCTRFKLQGEASGGAGAKIRANVAFWKDAAAYARKLWRWELTRLTGASGEPSDRRLLERWMRLQPATKRVRGWLYVLRAQGWHRSRRNWLRWLRLARHASPRYCIYRAGSELFFSLPGWLDGAGDGQAASPDTDELLTWLPVTGERGPNTQSLTWQRKASEMVRNYNEFLVGTQA